MPSPKPQRLRQVALLIESSHAAGRGILRGVARYQREHNPWSLYFQPRGLQSSLPRWLRRWAGHGILARITTRLQAQTLHDTKLPVLDLCSDLADNPFPTVLPDHRLIAQCAFTHLRERGLSHFAYCGPTPGPHGPAKQRGQEFRRLVHEAGWSCAVYALPTKEADWDGQQEQLAAWLREQPKPLGIFASSDACGYQVLDACRRSGVAVPQEVAVVGVDDDPVLCQLSVPALSSIRWDSEQAGYVAAMWLERLMNGQAGPPGPIVLSSCEVVVRGSTDTYAFEDAALNRVLRFIREHACDGIRVSDLLPVAQLSVSELERRFHRQVGRTPKAELLRVQMERAKRLLCDTNLAVKIIARRIGFSSEQCFSDAFYRECGVRPMAYREGCRR